jgi:pyruvate-formate lyase-activating enzyme
MKKAPRLLYADDQGRLFDAPGLAMAGASGGHPVRLSAQDLIPLPPGSDLFMLPGRHPVGLDERSGRFEELEGAHAVAAFVAPAYTLRAHCACRTTSRAEAIPLNAYAAVGFLDGRYWVPAFRVDPDPRQDIERVVERTLRSNAREDQRLFPDNQARRQMELCAFTYRCPAARNYYHRRWEAPIPTAAACNARCAGCISLQPPGAPPSPMARLCRVPKAEEIAALMVPHLERAERAIASFGQGCEGEPLVNPGLLLETVRLIRARTRRGTLNLNTNASRPDAVERLVEEGLDSIRVSLCSARRDIYEAYHRPVGYAFDDVLDSIRRAKDGGAFVSLNYFVFPGVTDAPAEVEALLRLLRKHPADYIQMRNLNMDPDAYLDVVGHPRGPGLGIDRMMREVHRAHPKVRFGYYNPPKEWWGKAGTVPPEHVALSRKDAKARARYAHRGEWKMG